MLAPWTFRSDDIRHFLTYETISEVRLSSEDFDNIFSLWIISHGFCRHYDTGGRNWAGAVSVKSPCPPFTINWELPWYQTPAFDLALEYSAQICRELWQKGTCLTRYTMSLLIMGADCLVQILAWSWIAQSVQDDWSEADNKLRKGRFVHAITMISRFN